MPFIIDDLLLAPLRIFTTIAEKIAEMAEEELYGGEKIKQELLELQMRLELGEITEEEYATAETALMKRLEEGQRRRGRGG
jgi:cell shape-determining protein MreC